MTVVSTHAAPAAFRAPPPGPPGSPPKRNEAQEAATVFVVDDNLGVRKALRALLESAGLAVETYASGEEFLAAYAAERAGCLLLDVRLRQSSGLDLQDDLHRRKAMLPVIVLTGHGDVPTSVRALQAGAFDFLQKPAPPELLLERIRAALDSDRQARVVTTERAGMTKQLARLTPREREVTELLVAGKASKQIATAMNISIRTVEGYRRMVFFKMDVSSAAQLVRTVLIAREADSQIRPRRNDPKTPA